jgi:hypothetical protein
MYKTLILVCLFLSVNSVIDAQDNRWQQHVKYTMNIDFDVEKHQYEGEQKIAYTNNSPDHLNKVFYHLYFNAFQPGSMMDVRSRTIEDPDPRVGDRIAGLTPDKIGYQKVKSLRINGKKIKDLKTVGTILEVRLPKPIKPGETVELEMVFEAQVPEQIRRSGRNNAEGISYSMTQWYPKLCEYDYQGWHSNPYIGREFHGIWGDFDVTINIDSDYIIGGTGYLQNPESIGYGYADDPADRPEKHSWRFLAPNVHDFAWGADPDYTHTSYTREDGITMHFFYQEGEETTENWEMLPEIMNNAFDYINERFGQYPYKQYSFIQGGDGGMEYPMATLITGKRTLGSLVGVSVHELMHSWYQMMLGTNESLYPWMDEGFTTFGTNETMNYLSGMGFIPGRKKLENPFKRTYSGYSYLIQSGKEEPLSTHADHFQTNFAYGNAAYTKGCVFLRQLEYIVGEDVFAKALKRYYEEWKFKHPNPNDFIRVFEKESGLELDWYREYMVNTTHFIDYSLESFQASKLYRKNSTDITIKRVGLMPMPLDIRITSKKGKIINYTIPMVIMRGNKLTDKKNKNWKAAEAWPWTNDTYILTIPVNAEKIEKIEIDPSKGLADQDDKNNILTE